MWGAKSGSATFCSPHISLTKEIPRDFNNINDLYEVDLTTQNPGKERILKIATL